MNKLATVLSLLLIVSCGKNEEAATDVSFSSSTQAPSPAAPAPARASVDDYDFVARSASGVDIVSLRTSGDLAMAIAGSSATTMTSEVKESGKRKYYDSSGTQIAEVKPSDTGFKVRTPGGDLLWKVKISDDKIKVSNNEENRDPWVLKTGYADKAKVLSPGEVEVGDVRFASDPAPTRVRNATGSDAWVVQTGRSSAAWGVLVMDGVPREHQVIIIGELLSRGI